MKTTEQQIADLIASRDGEWGMTGSLEAAKGAIALKGNDALDDLNQVHVRLLAQMCTGQPFSRARIEIWLNRAIAPISTDGKSIDSQLLEGHIADLCNAGYAVEDAHTQQVSATELGERIINQIGLQMLAMDRHRMRGDLEVINRLMDLARR